MKKKDLAKKESKPIYPILGIFNTSSQTVKAVGKDLVFLKEILFFISSLTVPKTIEGNGFTGYWINQKYMADHLNLSVGQFRNVLEKLRLHKILVFERHHHKNKKGSESFLVFNKTLLNEVIAWELLKPEPMRKLKKIFAQSKPFPEKLEKNFQVLKEKSELRKKKAYERYRMKQKEKQDEIQPKEEPQELIKPVKERKIVIAETEREPASWEMPWTPTEADLRQKELEETKKKKYSDRISEENDRIKIMEQRKRRRKAGGKKL